MCAARSPYPRGRSTVVDEVPSKSGEVSRGGGRSPASLSYTATNVQRMERPHPVPPGYRYEWALFADWCAAADAVPMPASPETVAAFLHDNPAGNQTSLRRVAAINRVHRDAHEPEPGTVTAIRLRLDRVRSHRIAGRRTFVAAIVPTLPTTGWPVGLFGRRDALILTLYAMGLGPRDIAFLDRHDIAVTDNGLHVGGRHQLDTTELGDIESRVATRVWSLWHRVLNVAESHPSMRVLENYLRTGRAPATHTGDAPGHGPVVVPIDRWGAVPIPLTPMSAPVIAAVIAAHLSGTAPRHPARPERISRDTLTRDHHLTADGFEAPAPLDNGYYDAGAAARRDAAAAMTDVEDLLDDIDRRTEQILRRTMNLLGTIQE